MRGQVPSPLVDERPEAGQAPGGRASSEWWARQVLNLRPLACEASALPLSYAPGRQER